MNIAVLFNSDAPKYRGSYGEPIRDTVFKNGIIQASHRHMKVSVGDVLIYGQSRNWPHYDELTERVYYNSPWSKLLLARLRSTFRRNTVYALTFENMTRPIAIQLHRELAKDSSYLGLMEVDYSYGPHLVFFRNFMISKYRVEAEVCRIFYTMGEDDEKDLYEAKAMRKLGYKDVDWEDRGAHKTIFDDFDTLEHFRQVAIFRDTISPHLPGGPDDASELVMLLEDLNPQLFNAVGSAIYALQRGQNEEDVAQAALSGRRYLERMADVLFPARKATYKGRKVETQNYRNRIWAFVVDNLPDELLRQNELGKEVDRLIAEFNAGLHGDATKERVQLALVDVAKLTGALLTLNPTEVRKPYFAYRKRMLDFFAEVVGRPLG